MSSLEHSHATAPRGDARAGRPCPPRRRALVLALGATALAALALAASPALARVPAHFYGITPSTALTRNDFKRMDGASVGTLRFGISWPAIQPKRHGPYYWTGPDEIVTRAARHHISLLTILSGTPAYEAHGCSSGRCQTRIHLSNAGQRRDWQRFVRAAVERYGRHGSFWTTQPKLPYDPITHWQIWNEENNPNQHNSPGVYAKLVALSDGAITSRDPRGEAILGGMPGKPNGPKRTFAWHYLNHLYQHGAGKHLSGVALHPYSTTTGGIRDQIERTRKVLRRHHDRSTPILITEIGWGSGGHKQHPGTGSRGQAFVVSPRLQRQKLARSFGLLSQHRRSWRIGGVFWYGWRDPPGSSAGLCAFCYSSGLYEANGRTSKPALSAYKRFTRKAGGSAHRGRRPARR